MLLHAHVTQLVHNSWAFKSQVQTAQKALVSPSWNLTHQSAVRGPSFDEFPGYNEERIFSDYTAFYIGIGATAGVALLLILFNFVLGCCYKKYWYSRFTGNRYILPVFVLPPKDQTPLNI